MSLRAVPGRVPESQAECLGPNWRHPFLEKCLVFVDGRTAMEMVTEKALTKAYGVNERVTAARGGLGLYCGSNAKWNFVGKSPLDIVNNRKISIFALTTILTTPTETYAGIVGSQSPTQLGLITTTTATSLLGCWANTVTGNTLTLAAGQVVAAGMRSNSASANTIQGTSVATPGRAALGTAVGSAGALGYPSTWEIGGDSRGAHATARYIEQVLHFAVVVNDYWDQAVFDELQARPWQLFESTPLYIPKAVSSLPTLTWAAPTSVTTTNFTPRVSYAY